MWKSTVLRGPVLLQGYWDSLSLKLLDQGILEIQQRLGPAGSWAYSTLMSIFFLRVREFFVLHRMVGKT